MITLKETKRVEAPKVQTKLRDIPYAQPFLGNPWGYGYGLYVRIRGGMASMLVPIAFSGAASMGVAPFGDVTGGKLWTFASSTLNSQDFPVDRYEPVDLEITPIVREVQK